MAVGDTAVGEVNPDHDYFAFDAAAGVNLLIWKSGNTCLTLYYADQGVAGIQCGSAWDGNSFVRYTTPQAGHYVLRMSPFEGGYPGLVYRVAVTAPAPGLGDPVRLVATGFGQIDGMTPAPAGGVYVADNINSPPGERISRVSIDGTVTHLASGIYGATGMATDGFGDLLVPSYDSGAVVWRISPTGAKSRFVTKPAVVQYALIAPAIGPDGDVWFADPTGSTWSRIWRYDPLGNLKDTIRVDVGRVFFLKVSPAGELHFTTQQGHLYKLVNRVPQLVLANTNANGLGQIWADITFDQHGWLYAIRYGEFNHVVLLDPQYRVVRDPLALVVEPTAWMTRQQVGARLAFARDANGAMTSRFMVARTDGENSVDSKYEIVELNHAGMGAPGYDHPANLLRAQLTTHAVGRLGSPYADTLTLPNVTSGITWSVIAGRLPPGVELQSATGVLTGTPSDTGSFDVSVKGSSGAQMGYGRFVIPVTGAVTPPPAPPTMPPLNTIVTALLGGAALTAAVAQALDQQGNQNGILDVGDLRAYLHGLGQIPGSAAARQ
jgi:hypothetical protein